MRRVLPIVLVAGLLSACQAFGNLTTGAMTTTNSAVGAPPAGPSH